MIRIAASLPAVSKGFQGAEHLGLRCLCVASQRESALASGQLVVTLWDGWWVV